MKTKLYIFLFSCVTLLLCLTACADQTSGESSCAHYYGAWETVTEATCTTEGVERSTCALCGEVAERKIPYAAHEFERTIYVPTCQKAGYTRYQCACGYTVDTDPVPAAPHTLTKKTVAPTCKERGYTHYECACGYAYGGDFVPVIPHNPVPTVVAPTCEEEGHTHYACACGYEYDADFVAPSGHRLSEEVVPPTCTAPGATHYECLDCDYEYDVAFVQPLGHDFESTVVRPTATWPGYTDLSCTVCDYACKTDYIYYSDILENAYVSSSEVVAQGLDVSKWNHQLDSDGNYLPLDWNAIKAAGYDFVILKAGGSKGAEPTFEMDYAAAKEAGLDVGAYFYTYALTVEAIEADVQAFLTYLDGKQFEYPVYLDIEDPSQMELGKNHLSDMCEAFLTTLQSEGYYAALYTNNNWLTTLLDTPRFVSRYDIWYARPLTNIVEPPAWDEDKYGKQLGMWQYTWEGSIEGVGEPFDLNYAYRDYPAIMKEWGLNGY